MMLSFFKYQGTGNDFVILDNRSQQVVLSQQEIAFLCHRRLGIGADGLMLLQEKPGYDFEMVYYNADGKPSSMCGNGARCMVAFAASLGIIEKKTHFLAVDGPHEAIIPAFQYVSLKMQDVNDITRDAQHCVLNTGSPHYIQFEKEIDQMDVVREGRKIRYSDAYAAEGINVNFVVKVQDHLQVRTYERGVEDETLSCGTGVTAAALASADGVGNYDISVQTPGGHLRVSFEKKANDQFHNIWLSGPATFVFKGNIDLSRSQYPAD